ncbi:MAG TPA: META domain-containing protein, partial [Gemmatimonadaceae bacterium]
MMSRTRTASVLLLLIASTRLAGQVSRVPQSTNLAGTAWQLVRFQGGDGTTLTPDVRSKYTIAFESDGRFAARIDCNRANGTWSSIGANQLTFGPLAVTRVLCPPGSLYNQMVRQWPYVRSYVMRNGHLFLSLTADGGIYEFEPLNAVMTTAAGPIRGTATYRERVALPRQAVFEATLEDVSRAGAASELIARVRNEQPGNVPIAF